MFIEKNEKSSTRKRGKDETNKFSKLGQNKERKQKVESPCGYHGYILFDFQSFYKSAIDDYVTQWRAIDHQ